MKHFPLALTFVSLIFAFSITAFAADGVTTGTATIGGSTAQVTYVTMTDGRCRSPGHRQRSDEHGCRSRVCDRHRR